MISKGKQRIVITLEKNLLRQLNELAKRERRSRSAVVAIALERLFQAASPEDARSRKK